MIHKKQNQTTETAADVWMHGSAGVSSVKVFTLKTLTLTLNLN